MKRLSLSVLLTIAVLAGVVAGMTFRHPSTSVTPVNASGGSETVTAFYAALNKALSGGATGDLAALLAPSFQDHDAASGVTLSAEEFVQTVRGLGQAPGAIQLDVTAVEASGNSLIVSVQPTNPRLLSIAGVSIEQTAASPGYDVLRIMRGKVVDRWAAGGLWLNVSWFEALQFQVPGVSNLTTSLLRIQIPSGTVREWMASLPGFLLIETGSAMVSSTHGDGRIEEHQLAPGAAIALQDRDRIRLEPATTEPVSILIYIPIPLSSSVPPPPVAVDAQEPRGVTRSLLWRGTYEPAGVKTAHRLGSIELPAGYEIRLVPPEGVTVLLSIDSGALDIFAPGSAIQTLSDNLAPASHEGYSRIEGNRAASIAAASSIILRNTADHPVSVLSISVEPEPDQV